MTKEWFYLFFFN